MVHSICDYADLFYGRQHDTVTGFGSSEGKFFGLEDWLALPSPKWMICEKFLNLFKTSIFSS